MREMTNRQRLLAVLHGGELDRVPFVQYEDVAAPNAEIWSIFGRNHMGRLRWTEAHILAFPSCRFEAHPFTRDGLRGQRTVLTTPRGTLTEETLYEPTFGSGSIKKHYVSERRDWDVFLSYLRDVVVVPDQEKVQAAERELGDDGLPHVSVLRTPYQHLWIQCVSLDDLILALEDWPDITAECIAELIRIEREIFRAVAATPVPYVVFPDNITAPPIGEKYFRRYCVPLYDELGAMLEDRGIPVFVHTDGDLKPLWKAIGESRVEGLDSLSPPPDNDTSAGDAVSMWPRMRVFLNYPSSVHVMDAKTIYRTTCEILEEAGHSGRLSIQISENVPPGVWRNSFPPIIHAIDEFGKP
jgi:hypothetical protein